MLAGGLHSKEMQGLPFIWARVWGLNLLSRRLFVHPGLAPFLRDGAAHIYSSGVVCLLPAGSFNSSVLIRAALGFFSPFSAIYKAKLFMRRGGAVYESWTPVCVFPSQF